MEPALYLLPVPLSEVQPATVLPEANFRVIMDLRHFVVENIRSARRFLRSVSREIDIDSLHFYELSEHTPASEVEFLLAPLEKGESIGLLSEAGCPGVADPGADLIALAQRKGMRVVPMVGPSSIILSLMASGFNGQNFAFIGYLPVESRARISAIRAMEREIKTHRRTQIFIETPYRNNRLIHDLLQNLSPDMLLCVASDITGPRESIVTLPVRQWKTRTFDYSKIPSIFLLYN